MTTVREINETEKEYWNTQVQRFQSAHPLNAFEWGDVRRVDGWTPIYLSAERDGKCCGAMMILSKKLPLIPLAILYAQEMPIWNSDDEETLSALVGAAIRIAKRENAIFLRVNPNIREESIDTKQDKLIRLGFRHLEQRWSFWNSPRDEARIDLTKFESPQHYFDHLPKTTRAAARKTREKGVEIKPATSKTDLAQFYEMFRQFSIERSFLVRAFAYQEKLWDTYLAQGMGRLLVARYGGRVVGGSLDLVFGGKCLGMHGGSLRDYRNLGIDDACNAEAIMWAKKQGCSWYSFRGLGSTPSQEAYKRKFMIEVVSLVGYYDLPFKPLLYRLFYWGEFTLLPFSWPMIVWARRQASRVMKRLAQTKRASSPR